MYMCTYMYIYVCIYIHTYTHIQTPFCFKLFLNVHCAVPIGVNNVQAKARLCKQLSMIGWHQLLETLCECVRMCIWGMWGGRSGSQSVDQLCTKCSFKLTALNVPSTGIVMIILSTGHFWKYTWLPTALYNGKDIVER